MLRTSRGLGATGRGVRHLTMGGASLTARSLRADPWAHRAACGTTTSVVKLDPAKQYPATENVQILLESKGSF